MNPWETERQRSLFLAEEAAWKTIQPLQAQFSKEYGAFQKVLSSYNAKVNELERITGQATGLLKGGGKIGSMVFSPVNMAFGMVEKILSMIPGIGGLFSKKAKRKKQRAQALLRDIEAEQSTLMAIQQKLVDIEAKVTSALNIAESIRANQPAKMAADVQQNVTAQQERRNLDTMRANVLQQRIKQSRVMRAPGGPDNAI
jgi:hypothetical protein